jgi:agmatinase
MKTIGVDCRKEICMKHHFLYSEYPNTLPELARFHVIPVPLEATVSYGGGTANGPQAILDASGQLETYVEPFGESGKHGIYTHEPIACDPPILSTQVFQNTALCMHAAADHAAVPILLGGEHSITNGAIEFIKARYRPQEVGILQFDAHMDLRDTYEGTPWSHACVMKRAVDAGIPLFQVGIRNFSVEELQVRKQAGIGHVDASELYRLSHSPEHFSSIELPPDFPSVLYISFDVDCFDASLMGATGTPDPGGLSWWDSIQMLDQLTVGRTIIGADVVELAPIDQLPHCSYTAAKLAYHLMGLIHKRSEA